MAGVRALRSWRRKLPAFVVLIMAGAGVVSTTSANASASQLNVAGQSGPERFSCQFAVTKVDTVHGTVTANVRGSASPTSITGYSSIVHQEVVCVVTDDAQTTFLGELDKQANGASVSGSATFTFPFFTGYRLCGAAEYTTRNGATSSTEAVCSSAQATTPSPSDAGHLMLATQNTVVREACAFDVQQVDNANGVVVGTMKGTAFPSNAAGYFTIAHESITCTIFDHTGTIALDSISGSADGPVEQTGKSTVTVPYLPSGYVLCGTATAVLNSGASSTVAGCVAS